MGAKHTPGPWEATLGASGMTAVEADNGTIVASYVSEANARLIASAPELLEAAKSGFLAVVGLKMAIAVESNGWQWPDDAPDTVPIPAENLRAAIAKATGEAS